MKPMRTWDWLDWFAFVYAVTSVLVMIAIIVDYLYGPW